MNKKLFFAPTLILLSFFCNAQQKLERITSYSLGEVYEKIKDDNFLNFKLKCNSWVNNVKYQYAVQLLNDSRNENTLIQQIKNENLQSEYEELLSNLQKTGGYVGFYSTSDSECPLIKFKFVKNLLDFYAQSSAIYAEIDNLQTDKVNARIDFDSKVKADNDKLINAKQLENQQKINELETQYSKILNESGLANQADISNNKIQSLQDNLQRNLINTESDAKARIKKLPVANFSANKQKIISETESKKSSLRLNAEKQILVAKKEYNDKMAKLDDTYGETLTNLKKQKGDLDNFDYESIKVFPKFDDSKYTSQQETKIKELENAIQKFNKNVQTLESLRKSGSKVINLL